jgi:hypothetical protein
MLQGKREQGLRHWSSKCLCVHCLRSVCILFGGSDRSGVPGLKYSGKVKSEK